MVYREIEWSEMAMNFGHHGALSSRLHQMNRLSKELGMAGHRPPKKAQKWG